MIFARLIFVFVLVAVVASDTSPSPSSSPPEDEKLKCYQCVGCNDKEKLEQFLEPCSLASDKCLMIWALDMWTRTCTSDANACKGAEAAGLPCGICDKDACNSSSSLIPSVYASILAILCMKFYR